MYFLSLNGVMIASLGFTTSYMYTANLEKVTNTYSIQAKSCAGTSTQTSAAPISFSSQLIFYKLSYVFMSIINLWSL